ncbi:ribosomal protein S5 domain 2-type protein [Dichotomocladium elegans]|nr:ribosomal protein S5 domain 2-type protein [Dichotomocladium elegans]
MTSSKRLLISAPGKVILFGEHAVVHKKLAVAASLGLRTYLYLEQNESSLVRLKLPDVQIDTAWSFADLNIEVDRAALEHRHPSEMPAQLKAQFDAWIGTSAKTDAGRNAVFAFLYLFQILKKASRPSLGFTISTRSTLPVGAGLGSSASFATAMAAALLILFGHVPQDFSRSSEKERWLDIINSHAFKAEQVIHGNPSGLDNAVATYGGAMSFRRGERFTRLEGLQSLRLLLTNTKVPRSTNLLVAGVGAKKEKYPTIIDPILDAIDNVSLRCVDAFQRFQTRTITADELTRELADLVDINHSLLHAIGVSHVSLETVRNVTSTHGIKTKLTGAGGGGCALSIIQDDVSADAIDAVSSELRLNGFDCYSTSLGGIGVSASVLTADENDSWIITADRQVLENLVLKS